MKILEVNEEYSAPSSQLKIEEALKKVNINKAAGFDGIYLQMLKNTGIEKQSWLAELYSDILNT